MFMGCARVILRGQKRTKAQEEKTISDAAKHGKNDSGAAGQMNSS
jgi:hypothetical protein